MNKIQVSSLSVTYDNEEVLSNPLNVINVGIERQEHSIMVEVDGSDTVNHFTVTCEEDWVTLRRVRNSITMIVNANTGPYERSAYIRFQHNMDADARITLILNQDRPVYKITTMLGKDEVDTIVFGKLFGPEDPDSETETVTVECIGGLCDYLVRGVVQMAKSPTSTRYRLVPYDNGVKVVKTSPSLLKVTNFGKISKYDDMYYEIVLGHMNNLTVTKRIKVVYKDKGKDEGSGFELDDDVKEIVNG